jgi:hypothetical protein
VPNEEAMEIKRELSELDCTKMLIHPLSPHLVPTLEAKMPQLKTLAPVYTPKKFTRAQVYRYLLLMYDKHSPVAKMMALDHFEKKFEACSYAGFELTKGRDGYLRFEQEVLDMILGKNDAVNDMVIAFIGYQSDERWAYVVYLKESMLAFTRDALGKKITDYKSAADYKKLYDDYMRITSELARDKEETEEFVNRFYYQIEQSRLAIKPEDFSNAINEGADFRADNPYSVSYVVDKIRFLGESVDEV